MDPEEPHVAWAHSPTRRSWVRYALMAFLGLLAWIAAWLVLLYVLIVHLPSGFIAFFLLPLCYCFYRAVVQLCYFRPALRMRRILRTYSWQVLQGVSHGLGNHSEVAGKHYGWFEFPNPAAPEQRLPLVFARHYRTEWWHRRMAPHAKPALHMQIGTVWFAGDPRFIGLIAAPGKGGTAPRRLHVLEQRMALPEGRLFAEWGATAADVERGRRVGISTSHS